MLSQEWFCNCDGPNCQHSNYGGVSGRPTRLELTKAMSGAGWKKIGGKDYCPDCVVEIKAEMRASREVLPAKSE